MNMSSDSKTEENHFTLLPGMSKFSSFLDTNHPPSDDTIAEIQQLLGKPGEKLRMLEKEIHRIESIHHNLITQHKALLKEISMARGMLSSARRVPPEVLQEIFLKCLPGHVFMRASEAPLLLTQICQNWRNIAHATPELWSSLHIIIPSHKKPYSQRPDARKPHKPDGWRSDAVNKWLGRSGVHALSLSLKALSIRGPTDLEIIDALLRFSPRWHTLDLTLPSMYLAKITAATDVPMLESVAINEVESEWGHFSEVGSSRGWGGSELLKAPNLRRLSIPSLPDNPIRLPMKWQQLTSLRFQDVRCQGDVTPLNFVRALEPCIQLKSLILVFRSLGRWIPNLSPPLSAQNDGGSAITLPSLDNLEIIHSGNNLDPLFRALETPSLRSFTYSISDIPSFDMVSSFLSRIPALRGLVINREVRNVAQDQFVELLRHCPRITSLSLTEPHRSPFQKVTFDEKCFNGDVLEMLAGTHPSAARLCPELDDITVWRCSGFSDDELLKFVLSKWNGSVPGVAKLKRMHVHFNRVEEKSIREVADHLKEQGLHFSTLYLTKDEHVENSNSALFGPPCDDSDDLALGSPSISYDHVPWFRG